MAATLAAALIVLPAARAAADQSDDLKLGQSVYNDLLAKGQIVSGSPYERILQQTGSRISRAAEPHWFTERFYIVRGNQMNAFSAPGGYVFVNEGLLRSVDNVPELANVLGHETAHIVLGHVNAQAQQQKTRQGIFSGLGKLFGKSQGSQNTYNVAQAAGNYTFLNFTRQQEYAADELGATLAAKAGYDPWGTVWFAREAERLDGDAGYESYVQHHPSTKDRITKIEAYFKDHPATFGHWSSQPPPGNGLPL